MIKATRKKEHRPDWEEYYLNITKEVAERSSCMSVKIGAIIVKEGSIVSTGYVGAPRNTKDCFDRGNCLRRELKIPSGQRYELCRSVHAEQNAIINAARTGANIDGADMYLFGVKRTPKGDVLIKAYPCFICKKMIINAGIKRVIGTDVDGTIKIYHTDDWIKDWSVNDLIDDKEMHKVDYCEINLDKGVKK